MVTKIENEQDMEDALLKMTEEQREHLRFVISSLVGCYLNDEQHALLLVTSDKESYMQAIAINSTDMEAAALLNAADAVINFRLLDEAPAKGMMN